VTNRRTSTDSSFWWTYKAFGFRHERMAPSPSPSYDEHFRDCQHDAAYARQRQESLTAEMAVGSGHRHASQVFLRAGPLPA
jgi:hypothetical protein